MTQAIIRKRIEVLVDAPLARRVTDAARASGIKGWTLLPTLSGEGSGGAWSDDQLSGAQSKTLFLSVASAETAAAFVERIAPLLDSHGMLLLLSDVEVVRAAKF